MSFYYTFLNKIEHMKTTNNTEDKSVTFKCVYSVHAHKMVKLYTLPLTRAKAKVHQEKGREREREQRRRG